MLIPLKFDIRENGWKKDVIILLDFNSEAFLDIIQHFFNLSAFFIDELQAHPLEIAYFSILLWFLILFALLFTYFRKLPRRAAVFECDC